MAGSDYYSILGVPSDASPDEIRKAYERLIRRKHPDKYIGIRARYMKEGDEDVLEIINEEIERAEEFCKILNGAYEVLSDPESRRKYDESLSKDVDYQGNDPPIIVVSQTELDFGLVEEGRRRKLSFVVDYEGGFPEIVRHVDWDNKPDWGDLVIKQDAVYTFPLEVDVYVDTAGIPAGVKSAKIVITFDDVVGEVEVFLRVEEPPQHTGASSGVSAGKSATGAPVKKPVFDGLSLGALVGVVLFMVVVIAIISSEIDDVNRRKRAQNESRRATAQVAQNIEAKATQEAERIINQRFLESEAAQLAQSPGEFVSFERLSRVLNNEDIYGEGYCTGSSEYQKDVCRENIWVQYKLVNGFTLLSLRASSDYYTGCRVSGVLEPQESVQIFCLEYSFDDDRMWNQYVPCIDLEGEEVRGVGKLCVDRSTFPIETTKLSDLVSVTMRKVEIGWSLYMGIPEAALLYKVKVGNDVKPFLSMDVSGGDRDLYWTDSLAALVYGDRSLDDYVLAREVTCFGGDPCRYFPGRTYKVYTPFRDWDSLKKVSRACLKLSAPYFETEVVCGDVLQIQDLDVP